MGSYANFSLFLRISYAYTVKHDHIHPPSTLLKHSPSIPAPTLAPCPSQLCVLFRIISTGLNMELSVEAGDIDQWSWSYIKSQSANLLQPLKYTQNVKGGSAKIATSPLKISSDPPPCCLPINRNTASCSPLLGLRVAFTALRLTPPLTLTTKKELTNTIQNLLKLDK